jgi:ribosomal-protein-alanine N-acetyltransferase
VIATERLELVPATAELARAALDGESALAARLGVVVPATWPPEFLDPPALEFTLDRLAEGPQQAGWWLHFVVLARGATGRTLIGSAGYKGPPSPDGTVEVGYGIVRDHQRQGYASETVRGLLERAFAVPAVQRVIAETLPELTPSGVIRFKLTRAEFSIGTSAGSLANAAVPWGTLDPSATRPDPPGGTKVESPARRKAAVFIVPMIVGLAAAQRAAPHVRTVDFLLLFASGVVFGVSLMGLIQMLRARRP